MAHTESKCRKLKAASEIAHKQVLENALARPLEPNDNQIQYIDSIVTPSNANDILYNEELFLTIVEPETSNQLSIPRVTEDYFPSAR